MMRTNTSVATAIIATLASSALGTLIYVTVTAPAADAMRRLQYEYDALNTYVSQHSQSQLEEGRRQEEQSLAQLAPTTEEMSRTLQSLTDDLSSLRFTDRSLTMDEIRRSDRLFVQPLTVTCRGSFEGIWALLDRIESYDRLTQIDKVSLARSPASEIEGVEVTLHLNIAGRVAGGG